MALMFKFLLLMVFLNRISENTSWIAALLSTWLTLAPYPRRNGQQ